MKKAPNFTHFLNEKSEARPWLDDSEVRAQDPELASEIEEFIADQLLAENGYAQSEEERGAYEHKVFTDCEIHHWRVYRDSTLSVVLWSFSDSFDFTWDDPEHGADEGEIFSYTSGEIRQDRIRDEETTGDNRVPESIANRILLLFLSPDAPVEELLRAVEKRPELLASLHNHPNWPSWISDWNPWFGDK